KKIYFIGTNLVGADVIDINTYSVLLEAVFKRNMQEGHIVYMPHRFENVDYLQDLFKCYSIEVIRPNNIIEIFFISNKIVPKKIISFYSTAIFSLKKIFPQTEVNFEK